MKTVVVRGAGDLATGIIYKLIQSGFKVIALETKKPTSIRRHVSLSEAVYDGEASVEDLTVQLRNIEEAILIDESSIVVDPKSELLKKIRPFAVVDAILAKKNLGTTIDMADIVIGVGPGFDAGSDCHAVVETKRGHQLGRIYYNGKAIPNTGIPGVVGGETSKRVIHAPIAGVMKNSVSIGDIVTEGDLMFTVDGEKVLAPLSGVVRGILRDGFRVPKGMKAADIDPRLEEVQNCETISDKARTIAGGVLEAILNLSGVIS